MPCCTKARASSAGQLARAEPLAGRLGVGDPVEPEAAPVRPVAVPGDEVPPAAEGDQAQRLDPAVGHLGLARGVVEAQQLAVAAGLGQRGQHGRVEDGRALPRAGRLGLATRRRPSAGAAAAASGTAPWTAPAPTSRPSRRPRRPPPCAARPRSRRPPRPRAAAAAGSRRRAAGSRRRRRGRRRRCSRGRAAGRRRGAACAGSPRAGRRAPGPASSGGSGAGTAAAASARSCSCTPD